MKELTEHFVNLKTKRTWHFTPYNEKLFKCMGFHVSGSGKFQVKFRVNENVLYFNRNYNETLKFFIFKNYNLFHTIEKIFDLPLSISVKDIISIEVINLDDQLFDIYLSLTGFYKDEIKKT